MGDWHAPTARLLRFASRSSPHARAGRPRARDWSALSRAHSLVSRERPARARRPRNPRGSLFGPQCNLISAIATVRWAPWSLGPSASVDRPFPLNTPSGAPHRFLTRWSLFPAHGSHRRRARTVISARSRLICGNARPARPQPHDTRWIHQHRDETVRHAVNPHDPREDASVVTGHNPTLLAADGQPPAGPVWRPGPWSAARGRSPRWVDEESDSARRRRSTVPTGARPVRTFSQGANEPWIGGSAIPRKSRLDAPRRRLCDGAIQRGPDTFTAAAASRAEHGDGAQDIRKRGPLRSVDTIVTGEHFDVPTESSLRFSPGRAFARRWQSEPTLELAPTEAAHSVPGGDARGLLLPSGNIVAGGAWMFRQNPRFASLETRLRKEAPPVGPRSRACSTGGRALSPRGGARGFLLPLCEHRNWQPRAARTGFSLPSTSNSPSQAGLAQDALLENSACRTKHGAPAHRDTESSVTTRNQLSCTNNPTDR